MTAVREALAALHDPNSLIGLDDLALDHLLHEIRRHGLLARVGRLLQERNLMGQIPAKAQELIADSLVACEYNQLKTRYEISRLSRTLEEFGGPVILLKGGGYLMARLPPSRGRFASDVDILVLEESLDEVERALLADGWEPAKHNEYDQHYYRAWMHQLPPLWHPERQTVVDVHRSILPRTCRISPDVPALIEAARDLPDSTFKTLAPEDMILHSAVHMIYNTDLSSALRDLVDIHDLLKYFGADSGFWERLLERARHHGVERALYYAFRLAEDLLSTAIPPAIGARIEAWAPASPIKLVMDRLFKAAVSLEPLQPARHLRRMARECLYVRAHWLSMPPWLLSRHLTVKAIRRI